MRVVQAKDFAFLLDAHPKPFERRRIILYRGACRSFSQDKSWRITQSEPLNPETLLKCQTMEVSSRQLATSCLNERPRAFQLPKLNESIDLDGNTPKHQLWDNKRRISVIAREPPQLYSHATIDIKFSNPGSFRLRRTSHSSREDKDIIAPPPRMTLSNCQSLSKGSSERGLISRKRNISTGPPELKDLRIG